MNDELARIIKAIALSFPNLGNIQLINSEFKMLSDKNI